jgi:integral membrane protein
VNPSTVRTTFRTIAIAEAVSWALLLSAMFCKYVTESEPFGLREGGVPVAGMIHGLIFILFIANCIVSAVVFKWNRKTTLLALGSGIPPFFTVVFEVVADRKGQLSQPVGATSAP